MQELKISGKFKDLLLKFTKDLKQLYKDQLISVILYGSASSGEFNAGHSNLNILVVLENTDLVSLKKAAKLVNRATVIHPLFFSENYIATSADIFPIEFLDMQENYTVVFGKDVLKDISIDTKNLRFQCEQELKARLLNLKQLYLNLYNQKKALGNLLFKSFTSVLHILRNVLRLEAKKPPYQKQELLKELAADFQINLPTWEKILAAKLNQLKLSERDIEGLFANFIDELEKIVAIVDRL